MQITDIITALCACCALMLLLWRVRGWLLKPARGGKDVSVTVALTARGRAAGLENSASAIKWLRKNGSLNARVIIVDGGLDNEGKRLAGLISQSEHICLCSPEELKDYLIRS